MISLQHLRASGLLSQSRCERDHPSNMGLAAAESSAATQKTTSIDWHGTTFPRAAELV